MWNFLELLWVLAGAFSAYYMIQDALKKDGAINAQSAAFIAATFFGGILSLCILIANDGDKIVLFKKSEGQSSTHADIAILNKARESRAGAAPIDLTQAVADAIERHPEVARGTSTIAQSKSVLDE